MAKHINPYVAAADKAREAGFRALAHRISIEGRIVSRLVNTGLEKGYQVDVNDGEEWVVTRSTSAREIIEACFSTDEDRIRFRTPDGTRNAVFYLVYGNDGFDVISDYTDNETAAGIMAEVDPYVRKLELAA